MKRIAIILASTLLASVSTSAFAQSAGCEYQSLAPLISKTHTYQTYMASTTEASLLTTLPLSGKYKGRTVQSIGIDPSSCRTIATISLKTKPEVVGIWSFLPKGAEQGAFTSTEAFGHPQDLTVEHDGSSNPYLWLPDENSLGAMRFRLTTDVEGKLSVSDIQFVRMLKKPVASHTITVSADRRFIAVMGKISDRFRGKQTIKIFQLQDALSTGDVSNLKPISEFPLAAEQQPNGEYRQGLAIVGNTVFVLSGRPEIESANRLVSYTLMGSKLQSEVLTIGLDFSAQDGEGMFSEPEGLEIISHKGQLALAVGIVSGDKGKKTNRVYKLPLYGR